MMVDLLYLTLNFFFFFWEKALIYLLRREIHIFSDKKTDKRVEIEFGLVLLTVTAVCLPCCPEERILCVLCGGGSIWRTAIEQMGVVLGHWRNKWLKLFCCLLQWGQLPQIGRILLRNRRVKAWILGRRGSFEACLYRLGQLVWNFSILSCCPLVSERSRLRRRFLMKRWSSDEDVV